MFAIDDDIAFSWELYGYSIELLVQTKPFLPTYVDSHTEHVGTLAHHTMNDSIHFWTRDEKHFVGE